MSERITDKILAITEESSTLRTYYFAADWEVLPGQFIMLTDLENGEKPFSISEFADGVLGVTIKKIGKFTTKLFEKQVGDLMSYRGPYGSSFCIEKKKSLLVGGGYATPPLYLLARELLRKGAKLTVVNGARTKEDLVFCDRFEALELKYNRITDAGCFGNAGTSVDVARKLLQEETFEKVYVSGPELMMSSMRDLLAEYPHLEYEFLFERYMKCAIGICGNCTIDPLGIRLCVEGPVLKRHQVEQLTEFGEYHRDASGKKKWFKK